ncbi:MAG: GC-type dockerin domain-anchored protein [Phycisphaerales bacterium]
MADAKVEWWVGRIRNLCAAVPGVLALGACVGAAAAQSSCPAVWDAPSIPGVMGLYGGIDGVQNESVNCAIWWDPDGPGSGRRVVAIGGSFIAAGNAASGCVASYDPETGTWLNVASGLRGVVQRLAALPTGELVASGSTTLPGGGASLALVRWVDGRWENAADGLQGYPSDVAVLPSGELVVCGDFLTGTGIVGDARVVKRGASGWIAMGEGLQGFPHRLCVGNDGVLYMGGNLFTPSCVVASWDGQAWMPRLRGGETTFGAGPRVSVLVPLPGEGVLCAGSYSATPIELRGVAHLVTGAGVQPLPVFYSDPNVSSWGVQAGVVRPNGEIILAGGGVAFHSSQPRLSRWDGVAWSQVSDREVWTRAMLALDDSRLLVAGDQSHYNAFGHRALTLFDGDQPHAMGNGPTGAVFALAPFRTGSTEVLAVGGDFLKSGDALVNRMGLYDGSLITPIGRGVSRQIRCMVQLRNGDLLAAGDFEYLGVRPEQSDQVLVKNVVRWNGSTLVGMPLPLADFQYVTCLHEESDGTVYAGTTASNVPLQRWTGAAWQAAPGMQSLQPVTAIAADEPGRMFVWSGGRLYRYDGASAVQLGVALNANMRVMRKLPNGDLVCGGSYGAVNETCALARYRPSDNTWLTYNQGVNGGISSMEIVPRADGGADLLIGGTFTAAGGQTVNRVGRWVPESNQWSPVGSGANGPVRAICRLTDGTIAVGGEFTEFNGRGAAFLATLPGPCDRDYSCDRLIDGDDVIAFFERWDAHDLSADLNHDGVLDATDVAIFFEEWDLGVC